jgi:hypothetical protein
MNAPLSVINVTRSNDPRFGVFGRSGRSRQDRTLTFEILCAHYIHILGHQFDQAYLYLPTTMIRNHAGRLDHL